MSKFIYQPVYVNGGEHVGEVGVIIDPNLSFHLMEQETRIKETVSILIQLLAVDLDDPVSITADHLVVLVADNVEFNVISALVRSYWAMYDIRTSAVRAERMGMIRVTANLLFASSG